MKKETVSVLRPRTNEKPQKKVKGVIKKKNEKIMKKSIEENVVNPKPRGKKISIVNIENINFEKKLTTQPLLSVKKKTKNIETKVKSGAVKKPQHEETVEKKMAKTVKRRDDDEPAHGQLKKPKIEATKAVAKQKKEKKEVKIIETPETSMKSEEKDAKMLIENVGHLKLTKQHILSSIKAIKKLTQKASSSKSLLPTENNPILLQVTCMKVPKTPRRLIRLHLPHPIVGPSDDVAIFVPDLEIGRNKDFEKTVEHWEEKFREKGVTCIKQIIPMNQVKTEFNQFEMKGKLANSFDHFLADGRICGHLTHLLSKSFFKRCKPPTPVKLNRADLKEEINNALHKTCMGINSYGNTHTVRIGKISMKSTNLVENIWETCKTLDEKYPGGWLNIRAIHIKTQTSSAIPVYMNLSSKNAVPLPVVKPKRPRAYETVEGELTTLSSNRIVTVTPEGTVKLKKPKKKELIIPKKEEIEDDGIETKVKSDK